MLTTLDVLADVKGLSPAAKQVWETAREQASAWPNRLPGLRRIHDQLQGGPRALSDSYIENPEGRSERQVKLYRQALRHINLVRPALNRFVQAIHAGTITRRSTNAELAALMQSPGYAEAMALLCEAAFAYGTAWLVPTWNAEEIGTERLRWWMPNPLNTLMATDPMDVRRPTGLVEVVYTPNGLSVWGTRWVTEEEMGWHRAKDGEGEVTKHGLGMLPAVTAYGRYAFAKGCPYGESLVGAAAEASIAVTRNNVNLELLRSQQTDAILLLWGEIVESSADPNAKDHMQRFFKFDGSMKDFGAAYLMPEDRLESIMKLSDKIMQQLCVELGLPLDTFQPQLVTGNDASAKAAMQRAFALTQLMRSLCRQWELVEMQAAELVAARLTRAGGAAPGRRSALREGNGIEIKVRPQIAESDAEEVSAWANRVNSGFTPVEDAIDRFSPEITPERREALIEKATAAKKPEVFAYHIQYGALTLNEVRELALGLPRVPWGEERVLPATVTGEGGSPPGGGTTTA